MSQPPLLAGAVPELPVVGYSVILALKTDEGDVYSYEYLTLNLTHKGPEPLTLHAPAQATINAQVAEIERLKRERDDLQIECDKWAERALLQQSKVADLRREVENLSAEGLLALKAKQVAEVDEVMRLEGELATMTDAALMAREGAQKAAEAATPLHELVVNLSRELEEMREAAQAVVERWDSPLWKDTIHTAVFINRMRAALTKDRT